MVKTDSPLSPSLLYNNDDDDNNNVILEEIWLICWSDVAMISEATSSACRNLMGK